MQEVPEKAALMVLLKRGVGGSMYSGGRQNYFTNCWDEFDFQVIFSVLISVVLFFLYFYLFTKISAVHIALTDSL